MPYPELEYLSGAAMLVTLRAPNKQYFSAKSAFQFREHISNSQKNKTYYISVNKRSLLYFKKLLSIFTRVLTLLI